MSMIKEVAFVAIAVSDAERARKFYQETLELKPGTTAMGGAWVEYDLGTTTIGVGCHPDWKPSRDGTTVAFEVEARRSKPEGNLNAQMPKASGAFSS